MVYIYSMGLSKGGWVMEEAKPKEIRPYQRVYSNNDLAELGLRLDLPSSTDIINTLCEQYAVPDTKVSLSEIPQQVRTEKKRISYFIENPVFKIEQKDEQTRHKVLPGYIKIVMTHTNPPTLETLEFSNAEIHDIVLNPQKIIHAADRSLEPRLHAATNVDDALQKRNRFKKLQKKIASTRRNNPELEKDKRTLETYTSPETEESVRPYYSQEMLSLMNLLLPKGLELAGKSRVILSGNIAHKTTLIVELSDLLITDMRSGKQYFFPGKLQFEYDFNEKKGFTLRNVKSSNTGLLKLFTLAAVEPDYFKNPENIEKIQMNAFVQEPMQPLLSKQALLACLQNSHFDETVLTPGPAANPNELASDLARILKFNDNVPAEIRSAIGQFYHQSLLSLPNYICRSQAENVVLNGVLGEKFAEISMKEGKATLEFTMTLCRFGIQNPYIQDADQEKIDFPGTIKVSYTFDAQEGFTFSNMTFSNPVLYNLIMNTRVLFPQDPEPNDALAERFRATLTSLQETAAEQEQQNTQREAAAPESPPPSPRSK